VLCLAGQLVAHELGAHSFSFRRQKKDLGVARAAGAAGAAGAGAGAGSSAGAGADEDAGEGEGRCSSIFLGEALRWMGAAAAASEVEAKLACPGCAARVGAIRWAGGQCSCGTWVCPAIALSKKALDFAPPFLVQQQQQAQPQQPHQQQPQQQPQQPQQE